MQCSTQVVTLLLSFTARKRSTRRLMLAQQALLLGVYTIYKPTCGLRPWSLCPPDGRLVRHAAALLAVLSRIFHHNKCQDLQGMITCPYISIKWTLESAKLQLSI